MSEQSQLSYWKREGLGKRRDPNHPAVRSYVVHKLLEINKYVSFKGGLKILDVGCGNGFYGHHFEHLCGAEVWGIDYSEKMIELNPLAKDQKFVMSADDLKFKDDFFDMCFCGMLLHHVDNPEKVLREMARVSKNHVIFIEPNRNNPAMFAFSSIVKEEREALKFTSKSLARLAELSGLKVIASFSWGLLVPNKTPKFLTAILELFERRMPMGMTNMVICRK